ncbi:restriction endonuclease [Holotrichia oblita]|uniref:Restriction endonuclease n=1 Tax=Holotrichia oblita TaxID=644536 RepID=A0ACB9TVX9_HOLOL|nr:restriction endonuclease [Holotrichia oblita]
MKRAAPPDEHYGTENVVVIPDCSEEEYSKKEKEFLVALKKTPEEIQRIEEQTRGQANNPLRYKERCHRITASNFKDICSMKKKTSCVNKIYRDDDFWNTKIVTQLREFYFKCLLPEIIDPRSTRGREIRNPPR